MPTDDVATDDDVPVDRDEAVRARSLAALTSLRDGSTSSLGVDALDRWLPLAVAWRRMAAMALLAVGLGVAGWLLLRPPPPPPELQLPMAMPSVATAPTSGDGATGEASAVATTSTPSKVIAQIVGAVRTPGVFAVAPGARVTDLVAAAGGLAGDADPERINLAAMVVDGMRVYVPRRGAPVVAEDPAAVSGGGESVGGSVGGGVATVGSSPGSSLGSSLGTTIVSLNSATVADLDALPGVGPATAEAILTFRRERGGFRSVDELLEVRGIGEAKLAELRPHVRL